MFFENFAWGEEKLGLISGVSFILIGVFAYFIYLEGLTIVPLVLLILGMLAAAGTAVLFQLPRIHGMRPAISTFLGGMGIGAAVILWVLSCVSVNDNLIHEIIVFILTGVEMVLSFFAVGFLLLALYPETVNKPRDEKVLVDIDRSAKNEKESEIKDDLFDRL